MCEVTEQDLLREGIEAAQAGEIDRALGLFRSALAADCHNEQAWLWLAGIATDRREAIRALDAAVKLNPGNEQSREGLAGALLSAGVDAQKDGDRFQARKYFRRAVEARPGNEQTWLWMASVAEGPEEAIACLEAVLRINPQNERAKADFARHRLHSKPAPASSQWSCPLCQTRADTRLTTCSGCYAVLDLTQADAALANPHADERRIADGVIRTMEALAVEDNFVLRYYAGMGLLNLKRPEDALIHFRAARSMRPQDATLARLVTSLESQIAASRSKFPSESRSILIVDDSPTIRKLVGMTMKRNGYRVQEAGDGAEALERIKNDGAPDLVLLDVGMPGLDGYQVCKAIRLDPKTAKLPIIMLSGKDGFFNKMRGKMAGSDYYLVKPFQPEMLVRVVRKYCPSEAPTA